MTKFCPNCGNKMSDNAKFCMACGAKLSEYTSGGVDMHDSVVQRSQVGAASVGNVNISPVIAPTSGKESKASSGGNVCPKCGFAMTKIHGSKNYPITYNGANFMFKVLITSGFGCPKCGYKYVTDFDDYFARTNYYDYKDNEEEIVNRLQKKEALKLAGWDVSFL